MKGEAGSRLGHVPIRDHARGVLACSVSAGKLSLS